MIFVECDNDEALLRGLGIPKARFDHHASKPRVAKALQKAAANSGAIGLVDQDPHAGPPPYLKEFVEVENAAGLGLRRLKHRKDNKWLVEIQPDLEPWLYTTAKLADISPSTSHLPENYNVLHDHPKAHAKHLRDFVAGLLRRGNPRMTKLAEWLKN